ncbi:MAG: hypothetical protein JXD23_08135 [Spirochaetales bacterium]|nr:hypothetical protein [Spirochaetales bacterium]
MDDYRTDGTRGVDSGWSTGSDRRVLLVDELWDSIRTMVEESELDTTRKDELIIDLGQCEARRLEPCGVSLRSLPEKGVSDYPGRED